MEMFVNNPEGIATLFSVSVFMCVSLAVFFLFNPFRKQAEIRRRFFAQKSSETGDAFARGKADRPNNLTGIWDALLSFSSKLTPTDEKEISAVRQVVVQAGFLHPSAVSWYYLARIGLAVMLPFVAFTAFSLLGYDISRSKLTVLLVGCGLSGLMLPKQYMSLRRNKLRQQCRNGFPDLMDLLVVCSSAGISLDAALHRIRPSISKAYPYFGYNIELVCLEMQAGQSRFDAFEGLAERLGIQEAHNLGALMRQSQELGTNLSDGLRVYSEEMRDKRLSLAEEKAQALPAKLSVPLMLFIFPVILVVILLPVYIRASSLL